MVIHPFIVFYVFDVNDAAFVPSARSAQAEKYHEMQHGVRMLKFAIWCKNAGQNEVHCGIITFVELPM